MSIFLFVLASVALLIAIIFLHKAVFPTKSQMANLEKIQATYTDCTSGPVSARGDETFQAGYRGGPTGPTNIEEFEAQNYTSITNRVIALLEREPEKWKLNDSGRGLTHFHSYITVYIVPSCITEAFMLDTELPLESRIKLRPIVEKLMEDKFSDIQWNKFNKINKMLKNAGV